MAKSERESSYRFVMGGFALWGHFAFGLTFVALSPVLPLVTEEYGISHTMAGLLVSVVFIVEAASGLPGGLIVGRLGLRWTYAINLLMIGSVTLLFLSPNFFWLLILRIVYSLGVALMSPATGHLVMQWFRSREVPKITGLAVACTVVGFVISLATVAPLADIMGWQRVLGIFGAVGLAAAFAWLFWGKTREEGEGVGTAVSWEDIRAVVTNRTIWLISIADAAVFMQYFALSSWLPTFYNENRGMSLTQAGFITSLLPFMGIFSVILGGFLPAQIGSKRLYLIIPGVLAGVGGLGSYLIGDTTITYIAVMILGLGSWMCIPTIMTIPMDLPGMTPKRVALYWGWLTTISGTGIFLAPLVVGVMRDYLGTFVPGFLTFSVLAWFLFVAGFLLPKLGVPGTSLPGPSLLQAPPQD